MQKHITTFFVNNKQICLLRFKILNKFVYFCVMKTELNILKGIHPGLVVERELKKRHWRKNTFASDLSEHPQTLTAITKGRRGINTALALKMEKALGLEEGYLMILQVFYDIELEKSKQNNKVPNIKLFRPALFWDTNIETINWVKQKKAVIKRVFERGNEQEKYEIKRFYGQVEINKIISTNG